MCSSTQPTEPNAPTADGPPSCFGDAGRVCPKDGEGFFQPQPECVRCEWVRQCLRAALEKTGVMKPVSEPVSSDSGMVRFLKRWSDKKRRSKQGDDG